MAHHSFHRPIANTVACMFDGLAAVLWNELKEPKGRMQMFIFQLDRHYVKVLSYLSALVTCLTLSYTNLLLVLHMVCLRLVTLSRLDYSVILQLVIPPTIGELDTPAIHV